jgi:hypothetical protein
MSIIKSSTQTTAAGATANETPMLTPEEVLEQVRAMKGRIPEFVQLPNNRSTRELRRAARINPEFAREAFGTVSASQAVQSAIGNSPAELVQAEEEMTRWAFVESELSALLRGVAAANVIRRKRIAHAALQAYNVSKELVKQEDHASLLPHVERMKRLPKYGPRRAKAPSGTPPETPAPPTKPA